MLRRFLRIFSDRFRDQKNYSEQFSESLSSSDELSSDELTASSSIFITAMAFFTPFATCHRPSLIYGMSAKTIAPSYRRHHTQLAEFITIFEDLIFVILSVITTSY